VYDLRVTGSDGYCQASLQNASMVSTTCYADTRGVKV
jgi:hypothetical protein